jgi:hypothetical protein
LSNSGSKSDMLEFIYIHYIHTYIHIALKQAATPEYIHTYFYTLIHMYTYIHRYIHTYIHTLIEERTRAFIGVISEHMYIEIKERN